MVTIRKLIVINLSVIHNEKKSQVRKTMFLLNYLEVEQYLAINKIAKVQVLNKCQKWYKMFTSDVRDSNKWLKSLIIKEYITQVEINKYYVHCVSTWLCKPYVRTTPLLCRTIQILTKIHGEHNIDDSEI